MRLFVHSMRRPRHPVARFLSLVLGLAVIGVLMIFGLVVAGVLLVGGIVLLAVRQWKQGRSPAMPKTGAQPAVLEGEFVVVRQGRPVAH
jgi:hypothetical protein